METKKRDKLARFQFFDGYRGFCVIVVILQHTLNANKNISNPMVSGEYEIFRWTGTYVGVVGFFLLSSFLLTYRLFHLYSSISFSNGARAWVLQMIRITVRFLFGRFFRVFMPYMIYVTLLWHVNFSLFAGYFAKPGLADFTSSWWKHATLQAYEGTTANNTRYFMRSTTSFLLVRWLRLRSTS